MKKKAKKRVRKARPKPRRVPPGITEQQKDFCRHYLALNYNGTRAAKAAGYSRHTATRMASRLLSLVHVQAHLAKLSVKVLERAELKASELLAMLAAQATADPRKFVTDNSHMRKLADLDLATAQLITAWKQEGTKLTEIKLTDRLKAQEMLMKNRGMLKEQMSIEHSSELTVAENERIKEFSTDELKLFNECVDTVNRLLRPPVEA